MRSLGARCLHSSGVSHLRGSRGASPPHPLECPPSGITKRVIQRGPTPEFWGPNPKTFATRTVVPRERPIDEPRRRPQSQSAPAPPRDDREGGERYAYY